MSFAVTEPDAGSDLQNIFTTAKKSSDGKHYIVNGEKKWITNGMNSDYITTLVRTGGKGGYGTSMLLIPVTEGVSCRPISLGLDDGGTTAYITFEDVKVPVENLIGVEGQGFKYTISNFLHERMLVAFQALSFSRICLRETMTWCKKREAFGAPLIKQPVVRYKFAKMASEVESLQTWTEQMCYEGMVLGHERGTIVLGGTTALLKAKAGATIKYVADECQKLFGGLGMTKTGQGALVEAIVRRVPILVIPGGSEDVMLDLGTRQALKLSEIDTKARQSRL